MPLYFFRLRHGKDTLNAWAGVELADLPAVRHETCLIARDFMDRASGQLRPVWDGWWIEARNAKGESVLDMPLAVAGVEGLTGRRASGARLDNQADPDGRVLYLTPAHSRRQADPWHELESRRLALELELSVLVDRHRFARNSLLYQIDSARETVNPSRLRLAASRPRRKTDAGPG